MTDSTTDFAKWIGRREVTEDDLGLAPALAAATMLDDTATRFEKGSPLPALWHWFYFLPTAPQAQLDVDGHPRRGGFMPPIPFPRRMFAGARLRFHQAPVIGRPARRESVIRDIRQKSGRSGSLAFVSVLCSYYQDDLLCIEEEQDIVYREPGPAVACPRVIEWPPLPADAWSRIVTPDPKLLFRFSALTFNAHRIHYDRPYAIQEEGYPGLVVHGPFTQQCLLDLLRDNTQRKIAAFSLRARAPLFDVAPFTVVGGMIDADQAALFAVTPQGGIAIQARARLEP
jgi:3-methylfumaryl-CoA hydratase